MTALLCEAVQVRFTKAAELESFFDERELEVIGKFLEREQPKLGNPDESCKTNLFFGFFFDGMKNNYVKANVDKNHANLVRLYDCYPGQSVPGVLPGDTDWEHNKGQFTHFFKQAEPDAILAGIDDTQPDLLRGFPLHSATRALPAI